jgi:hypothetical protein
MNRDEHDIKAYERELQDALKPRLRRFLISAYFSDFIEAYDEEAAVSEMADRISGSDIKMHEWEIVMQEESDPISTEEEQT